ncbi:hypothetical protein [Haloarchaeobius amylolyticus]|uniref:hypothetical protein n=1 Tax=Haloarchaeobius amylolyticus TaxID=1198296 RepID=UPI00227164B0|nr:hypothetical protein [Haloarchaeobius amylolyticus]
MNPLVDARGNLALNGGILVFASLMVALQGGTNTWLTLAILVSGVGAAAAALTVARGPLPPRAARPIVLYGDRGEPVGVAPGGPSYVAVFYSLFTLPASIAHELAHALGVVCCRGRVESLVVVLGGDAYLSFEPAPHWGRWELALVRAMPAVLGVVVFSAAELVLASSGLEQLFWVYVAVTFWFSSFPDQVYDLWRR